MGVGKSYPWPWMGEEEEGRGRKRGREEGEREGKKSMLGSNHCNEVCAHVTPTVCSFPDGNIKSADRGVPVLAPGQGNLQVGLS